MTKTNTSLLQVMTRVKLAWYQNTAGALKNCWRKAGFGNFIGNADISMPIQDDLDKLVETINHRLDVPIAAEDLIEHLATEEILSEED